ncbi:MAG TPA: DUF3037 domain-containing protein [Polyangia bacterium]|nr:DUF3037 domain-containing protein [Polyangia bacterium]
MPAPAFSYAVVRVVPRVEREEFVNAGVSLFCAERRYLGCRLLDPTRLAARLRALAPHVDANEIVRHLETWRAVCEGDATAGPIAAMSVSERFHWLVAPRSTSIQTSAVHAGIADDPAATLAHLFETLVAAD